jgi:lysophospholipase L1-like esterase
MRLGLNDYRKITLGCATVTKENGKIRFHRFTKEEELFYQQRDAMLGRKFSDRCSAPAGVKLCFATSSKSLKITVITGAATSRSYFSFDVFENDRLLGYLANFNEEELLENYTEQEFPLGKYEKRFVLSDGKNKVTICFPWSVFIDDIEIELDDGADIDVIKPQKKLLVYGDSITQGYDAIRPSNRYASRIAEFLGAEEINKAIGGEIFVPPLVKEKLDFEPDYIIVAYGTNDWSTTDGKEFYQNVKSFYASLSKNYPGVPIFAITPIWRLNFEEYKPFGNFFSVERIIREATLNFKNVSVISGFELVGHDKKLYADLRLHPRDAGFNEYYENLSKKIGELI